MKLSKEDKEFLALYSDSIYEKPSVTVDSVIFRLNDEEVTNYRRLPSKKLQVFLMKRENSPFKDCYAIPGTFIDLRTELSNTMKLCVKNKVGINNFYYEQLYTFGDKSRDPRTRVLSCSYMLLTNKEELLHSGEWFNIDINKLSNSYEETATGYIANQVYRICLTNGDKVLSNEISLTIKKDNLEELKSCEIVKNELSFDHAKIIYYALERLRNKLEYTDIIFNLLPDKFTLTELKNSYEVILGNKLLDANFRRKIMDQVEPLDEYTSNKGHRPSQIFKKRTINYFNNID